MCYASAEGRSRDAKADEVLVVQRRPHGTNWLVSPEDASTPVCLRTGTAVELLYIPEKTQRRFGLAQEAIATFKIEHWWRQDLFVLKNGRRLRLKKLRERLLFLANRGRARYQVRTRSGSLASASCIGSPQ